MNKLRTYIIHQKASLYVLMFLLLGIVPHPGSLKAQDDYKYVDERGNSIELPVDVPTYTVRNPGPWKGQMNLIRPQIRLTVRKDGLETIKVIKIEVPYKPSEDGSERVISFFLLDKDNLIVGYQKFDFGTKKYKGEIWINGIINYIQVYILTSTKGMWKEEYHI